MDGFIKHLDIWARLFYMTKAVTACVVMKGVRWARATRCGGETARISRICPIRSRPRSMTLARSRSIRSSRQTAPPLLALSVLRLLRLVPGHSAVADRHRALGPCARAARRSGDAAAESRKDCRSPGAARSRTSRSRWRSWASSLPAAFIAIEDRRFHRHWGIDPRAIGRAFVTNCRPAGSSRAAAPSPSSSPRPASCRPTAATSARRRK